jgi:hypothetical protein
MTTLMGAHLSNEFPEEELVVIVGPRKTYAGTVTDQEGRLLGDVALEVKLGVGAQRKLRALVAEAVAVRWRTRSDAQGEFAFEDIAWARASKLAVTSAGFERFTETLPAESRVDWTIVLVRPPVTENSLLGRVVDADGNPLAGAWVGFCDDSSRTNGAGEFLLESRGGERAGTLEVIKEGFLPRRVEVTPANMGSRSGGEQDSLVVVLDGPPLVISGRVVDELGRPVQGVRVVTRDGTPLVALERRAAISGAATVEQILAGGGQGRDLDAAGVQRSRRGRGRDGVTDVNGRFELADLLPRVYLLVAVNPATLEVQTHQATGGDTDLEIVLRGSDALRAVAGQVTFLDGEPVEGASVRIVLRVPDSMGLLWPFDRDSPVRTDGDGRFAIAPMNVENVSLSVTGKAVARMRERLELDPSMDLQHLEIQVAARCRFQVVLRNASDADSLMVLDGDGQGLQLQCTIGQRMLDSQLMYFADGRTETIEVDQRARVIVLLLRREEVARIDVRLKSGDVKVVRF